MKKILLKTKKCVRRFFFSPRGKGIAHFNSLNEAVNFDLQCIFIAVPKTGTTSVRTQLSQSGTPLVPNPHLDIIQVRDLLYPFLLASALGRNNSFPSKTVPTDKNIRDQAKQIFMDFFKFSAVRNPWARAVSIYFRREGIQMGRAMTFENFCEQHTCASDTCLHPTLHKNQIDWLCGEDGLIMMDFVYKVEEFDAAIKEIAERTDGRVQLLSKESNRNPKSKSLEYTRMYNDKTKKIIAKNFAKDIDFFKYSFQ
jgi:hypothetical protein